MCPGCYRVSGVGHTKVHNAAMAVRSRRFERVDLEAARYRNQFTIVQNELKLKLGLWNGWGAELPPC